MTAQSTPVASSSRVRLDSACPIAWPSSSSASQHSITSTSSQHAAASSSHLRQRYHECLWLGEAYLPLVAFPSYAFDTSTGRREQDLAEAAATLDGIASLLRTRGQVQRRFRREMPEKVAAVLSRLSGDGVDGFKEEEEMHYVSAALASGPGRSIAEEHRQMTAAAAAAAQTAEESQSAIVKTTRVRDDWLAAIERRELSLQLLLILEVVRIGVEHPSLLIPPNAVSPPRPLARPAPMPLQSSQTNHDEASVDAEAGAHDTESQSRTTNTTRKKKRKAAPARRWTGFATAMALQGAVDDDGFPWAKRSTSSTKSGGTDLVTPGGENDDEDDEAAGFNAKTTVRDPEALHKLFEAFADRLSLRIVTSELRLDFLGLDEEMDKQAGEGSAGAKAAKTKAILFGTAARLREDGDERDEMHHLCSDIVEPRFARSLPRQCSVLRSKATVGGGGGSHATPHRSSSSLSTTTGRGGTASAERQRRRDEQQHSQLARIRSEADLATRKKLADEKARAKEAKRLSQRPGLKDALVMEQKERKFSRATSVVGGDAERNKREVSVKRRVGSLARGASSGNVWDESSSQQSQSAPAIPTMMKSGSLVLGPSATRVNKRKIAEPKRFGGHADGQVVKGELDDDVDNPFRDSKPAVLAAADDSQASSFNGSKRLKPTTGVFTRSESQVFSSKAASSSQSQGPFSASLLAPPPAAAGRRSLTGWQRTESQPVTSRDLSSLSSASASRSSSRQGSRRTSPFLVDDDDGGEGSDAGLDDEEDEGEADAPMLLRRPTNAFAAAASQSQSGIGGSRPLHGLGGLRTWTKTTSMAELPAFDLPSGGASGQSESQPSFVPSGELQESQVSAQESQGLATAAQEVSPLVPSTSSSITSALAAAASQSDTSLAPTQPTVSLTAASPPRPRPPMPPPLRRRPSGRNPFAKSASQQRLETTATVMAAATAADQSTSQAAALDSGADGQEDDMMASSSSSSSSMAADLGRLWRGDSSKWG